MHDAAYALFPHVYPRRGRHFHRRGASAAARRADLVITGSHSAAAEIVEHTQILAERVRVVPYGVDHLKASPEGVDSALQRYGLSHIPYLLWVGSFEPRKNVGTLVQAFSTLVSESDLPHHLVLVGPHGWLEKDLVDSHLQQQISDRLHVLGVVPEDDLRALYAAADVFAFPSIHEGFGLPVLEAMVQDTVVVCSDIPALREVAADGASFVTSTDAESWASALEAVIRDSSLRERRVLAGRRQAANFSWERTVRETHEVYEEALADR
jgi:glycosyltransferase involved in cell wall biosynthesis